MGSEMCIRDRYGTVHVGLLPARIPRVVFGARCNTVPYMLVCYLREFQGLYETIFGSHAGPYFKPATVVRLYALRFEVMHYSCRVSCNGAGHTS